MPLSIESLEAIDAQGIEGVEEAEQKVTKFVRLVVENLEREGKTTFEIFMRGKGQDIEDPITSIDFEPGQNVRELVKELVGAALEDASTYGKGVFRYDAKAEGVRAKCAFQLRVIGGTSEDDDESDIEDIDELPNKKGLMGLLMRHQEKTLNVLIKGTKQVQDAQARMLKDRDQRIHELEQSHVATVHAMEELVNGAHTRNLEIKRIEKQEQRAEQIMGILTPLVPVLGAKLLGGGNMPPPAAAATAPGGPPSPPTAAPVATPLEMQLEGLIQSMTSEQFQKMVASGLLTPAQTMALAEMAQMIQERQAARQPPAPEAPPQPSAP